MSLFHIYNTLQSNNDPLLENISSFEEFLKCLDLKSSVHDWVRRLKESKDVMDALKTLHEESATAGITDTSGSFRTSGISATLGTSGTSSTSESTGKLAISIQDSLNNTTQSTNATSNDNQFDEKMKDEMDDNEEGEEIEEKQVKVTRRSKGKEALDKNTSQSSQLDNHKAAPSPELTQLLELDEKDVEHCKKILAFRQYMYDQYIFGVGGNESNGSIEQCPPFCIVENKDIKKIEEDITFESSTVKTEAASRGQVNESKVSDSTITDAVTNNATHNANTNKDISGNNDAEISNNVTLIQIERKQNVPVLKSLSLDTMTYLERNSLRQGKLLDLLEPSILQKQREINKLLSKPSIIKQAIQKFHTPQRIWNTDNEEINLLYDHLYRVWKIIYNHPSAWPFYKPVTEDLAPQYYDIITNPIDLSTMQKSLRNLLYTSKQEFFNDIYLMCENCRTYNTDLESPFRHKGNEIEDLARLLQRTVPDIIVVDRSGSETVEKLDDNTDSRISKIPNGDKLLADSIRMRLQELEEPLTHSVKEVEIVQPTVTTRKGRGRGRQEPQAHVEDSSQQEINLQLPSDVWIHKVSKLRHSYLHYRSQQRTIPFEEQVAIERTPDSMGSYVLEKNGFDIQVEGTSDFCPVYHVVRNYSADFVPEYIYPHSAAPDTLFIGDKIQSLSIPNPNDSSVGALSMPMLTNVKKNMEKIFDKFDLLKWDNIICHQSKKLLHLQRLRLQKIGCKDIAEDIVDVGEESDVLQDVETLKTEELLNDILEPSKFGNQEEEAQSEAKEVELEVECLPLAVDSSLRGLVALFAAHSGFTHITTESSNILCELVDNFILTIGRNINHFLYINPEIDPHIAALRVIGVMGDRRSIPVMKNEWDNLISGMDSMIVRSMSKYYPSSNTAPSAENILNRPSNVINNITPHGLDDSMNTDDINGDESGLKRKREHEAFTPNKRQNLE